MSHPPPASLPATNRLRASLARRAACVGALAALAVGSIASAQTSDASYLINLSVRTKLAAGESLITGFVVTGSDTERVMVLLRGVGPSLAPFGITDAMPNPKITLTKVGEREPNTAVNDDADYNSLNVVQMGPFTLFPVYIAKTGAFPFAAGSRDAAMFVPLERGAYTLTVTGSSATDAGTVLAEVYDTRVPYETSTARLINMSVRGNTTPSAPLLSGFVVNGTAPKRMLLRVSGPALTAFGVAGAVADPRLDLMNDKGAVIRSNDNWESVGAAELFEVRQAALTVGAFAFPAASRDAATVVTLPPGSYTLRGSGADGASGVVLLEIYELPTQGEVRPST